MKGLVSHYLFNPGKLRLRLFGFQHHHYFKGDIMTKLIELDNLTKEYNGQVVLKGIHLEINEKNL